MQNLFSHPVIAIAIMLGSLVLFHELGHYLVGRLCGVAVERFAIGFGHSIAAFKRGQTEFLIGWIPLGGYVKFFGGSRNEDVPDHITGLLYWQAPVWKRALIVAAGPIANFLLAFVIFWVMVMHGIEQPPPVVGDVVEGSRADQAGIRPGDRLMRIDGAEIGTWSDLHRMIQKNPEREIDVVIKRDGETLVKKVTPAAVVGRTIFGSKAEVGQVEIALSYPSAVVTLTSPDSPLARDGIKTGDRVESWWDNTGQEHKINGLNETFKLFSSWAKNERRPVKISVRPVTVEATTDGRPKEKPAQDAREVVIDVSKWPPFSGQSDRVYAASLGVSDSHLTIGLPRDGLEGLLRNGDRVVSWNQKPVKNIFHLRDLMESWRSSSVELGVVRDFKEISIVVPLKPLEIQAPEGLITIYTLNAFMLGQMSLPEYETLREANPVAAARLAVKEGANQTSIMLIGLWKIVTGAVPIKSIGGPIMIAMAASDSAKAGWMAFFATMAVISINLGLVNSLPIPLLDGGQLVLLALESFKRAPLEESTVENFQKLGFIMVMSLLILAVYNDLSRFWGSIVRSIFGAP